MKELLCQKNHPLINIWSSKTHPCFKNLQMSSTLGSHYQHSYNVPIVISINYTRKNNELIFYNQIATKIVNSNHIYIYKQLQIYNNKTTVYRHIGYTLIP